jgi:hypothetical protein
MFDDPRDNDTRDRDDDWRERELDWEARERSDDPRDVFLREMNLPRDREREFVFERNHAYQLNGNDSRTLATVGVFRIVPERELSKHQVDHLRGEGLIQKDDRVYCVEVKNTLRYIDYAEFSTKMQMCRALGIRPVFAVRMLPKAWIHEVIGAGGFALILKHQLYPWAHRDLARRVKSELGLPVDAPRALEGGTMARFLRWHEGL